MKKICIVSPWNYPIFNPEIKTHIGGWETRMALVARGLAQKNNFKICMLVGDHGQEHREVIENIDFFSWTDREIWGIKNNRKRKAEGKYSFSKISGFVKKFLRGESAKTPINSINIGAYSINPDHLLVYDEINADIYMVPGNSQFSGELAYYCKMREKLYLFQAGSDFDYYPEYKLEPEKKDMYGVPFALKTYAIENASFHVVQSEKQAKMLKAGYSRDSVVIKNPIDPAQIFKKNSEPSSILWVGKSDERVKRPSLLLKLVKLLPKYKFVVIMPVGVEQDHAEFVKQFSECKNVELHGRIPFEEIEKFFADAKLHVNTSKFEGFPNTFLQAAKYAVPTVSFCVDPGQMLSTYGCGIPCNDNMDIFANSVQMLMENSSKYNNLSENSLKYISEHHDKNMIIDKYEQVFEQLLGTD